MHPIEPEELMAYLDGELPPQRASIAGDHLSHCLDCQLAAAEMQDVSRRLLEWQIEEPAPRVEQAVTSARPPEKLRPAWRRGVPWIAGLAAACLLLLLFVQPLRQPLRMPALSTPASWNGAIQQKQDGQQGQQGRADIPLRAFEPVPPGGATVATTNRIPRYCHHPGTPRHSYGANLPDHAQLRQGARLARRYCQAPWRPHWRPHIESPADTGQTLQATLRIPPRNSTPP